MIALTADCVDEIADEPQVRAQLESPDDGSDGQRRFWLPLIIGAVVGVGAGVLLDRAGWATLGALVMCGAALGGFLIGAVARVRFDNRLRTPVLKALAARAGLDYRDDVFTPPAYADAQKALIGSGAGGDFFDDLFEGKDSLGLSFSTYRGRIGTSLRNNVEAFRGQFYAIERRSLIAATTIVVSRGSFVSPFDAGKDMQRLRFESDPEFDKAFRVYGTNGPEAWQLLSDAAFRRRLVDLQDGGQLFAYIAQNDALIAVSGDDPCSPGSAYEYRTPYEQLRPMVEGMCQVFALLSEFKVRFG